MAFTGEAEETLERFRKEWYFQWFPGLYIANAGINCYAHFNYGYREGTIPIEIKYDQNRRVLDITLTGKQDIKLFTLI